MRLILACFFFLFSLGANADSKIPNRVVLEFKIITSGILVGKSEEIFQRHGAHYEVISTTKPRGIASLFLKNIHRRSQGTITNRGLIPDLYEEKGRGNGKSIAKFDWAENQVYLKTVREDKVVDLSPGAIDQTSFLFSFMVKPPKQSFEVQITDGRRIKNYTYEMVGTNVLKSPKGPLDVLILRKLTKDKTRQFEFWLAKNLYYLPVKIKYTDKKKRVFESALSNIIID